MFKKTTLKEAFEKARIAGFHARSIAWSFVSARPLHYSFMKRKAIRTGEDQTMGTGSPALMVMPAGFISFNFTIMVSDLTALPILELPVLAVSLIGIATYRAFTLDQLDNKMNQRAKKVRKQLLQKQTKKI